MSTQTLIVTVLISIAQAIYSDVIGYSRARQQWREAVSVDPITAPTAPTWDWPLCWSRIAGGFIAGVLVALSANAIDNNAADAAH